MCLFLFFFFKQKTAYDLRISDWSSDVCSSDLQAAALPDGAHHAVGVVGEGGRVVVGQQVGSDGVVPAGTQLLLDEVPVPTDVSAPVDQHEGRPARSLPHDHELNNRFARPVIDASIAAATPDRTTMEDRKSTRL